MQALEQEIRGHLRDGRRGELLRGGVRAVIAGPPNVGKSSLLNLLCEWGTGKTGRIPQIPQGIIPAVPRSPLVGTGCGGAGTMLPKFHRESFLLSPGHRVTHGHRGAGIIPKIEPGAIPSVPRSPRVGTGIIPKIPLRTIPGVPSSPRVGTGHGGARKIHKIPL